MELLIALAAIALAFVFWVVSPEPLRRQLRQIFVRLFRSHPVSAIEPDIVMFDGHVEMLTESLLSHPADAARTKQFYEADGRLDWDIIAAQADVERDQQADLIEQLNKSTDSLRFVCVLGESGSGKSTLAWRVAAELYRRHQALVVHVKGWEAPEVWYRMPAFCSIVRRHVFVLADDLFRDPEVRVAIQQLSPWLPLSVR